MKRDWHPKLKGILDRYARDVPILDQDQYPSVMGYNDGLSDLQSMTIGFFELWCKADNPTHKIIVSIAEDYNDEDWEEYRKGYLIGVIAAETKRLGRIPPLQSNLLDWCLNGREE